MTLSEANIVYDIVVHFLTITEKQQYPLTDAMQHYLDFNNLKSTTNTYTKYTDFNIPIYFIITTDLYNNAFLSVEQVPFISNINDIKYETAFIVLIPSMYINPTVIIKDVYIKFIINLIYTIFNIIFKPSYNNSKYIICESIPYLTNFINDNQLDEPPYFENLIKDLYFIWIMRILMSSVSVFKNMDQESINEYIREYFEIDKGTFDTILSIFYDIYTSANNKNDEIKEIITLNLLNRFFNNNINEDEYDV